MKKQKNAVTDSIKGTMLKTYMIYFLDEHIWDIKKGDDGD